ncbi:protein-export chaperone SecB [Aquimarina sp. I32.4]|uniref:protein-export chaperone SecB n=1 Tax=Aquimarina sp. I32.4 TaxID=2053903 RepID=UPI000CDF0D7F|nr:protein-export chaperone SecB [Aquimarina sp. I32.4]
MKIQLESWKVQNLSLNMIDGAREENSFGLKTGQVFPENERTKFIILFNIDLKDKFFNLDFEVSFVFSTEKEIDEEFKFSDFPKINAPAIAFPFIRSYISNLTLQSGFEAVILPSINFVKLAKED